MPKSGNAAFVQNYTDMGFYLHLLFLLIGTILTMIVQASAATMAITLLCAPTAGSAWNWEQHSFWEKTSEQPSRPILPHYSQYTG